MQEIFSQSHINLFFFQDAYFLCVIPRLKFLCVSLIFLTFQSSHLILCQNGFLNRITGLRIDRMCNIPVLSVCCLATRHCYKQTFLSFNYLNIMNDELIVQRDRDNGLHLALFFDSSHSNIRYLHIAKPLPCRTCVPHTTLSLVFFSIQAAA